MGIQFFQNLKISNAIILIALFPSVAAIFLAVQTISNENQTIRHLQYLSKLTALSITISNLIHEQQKERGTTAGFLGSEGTRFEQPMIIQRKKTDEKLQALDNHLINFDFNQFNQAFNASLTDAISILKQIEKIRALVDTRSISQPDATEFYSVLNSKMINTISLMSKVSPDTHIAVSLFAYSNFLRQKEYAGIERAVGANGFFSGRFTPQAIQKFTRLVSLETISAEAFLLYAKTEAKDFYHSIKTRTEFKEVSRMRDIVKMGGQIGELQGIDGEYWFDTITLKIESLKEVEDFLAADLHQYMESMMSVSNTYRLQVILLTVLIIVLTILLSITIISVVHSSIHKVVASTTQLAEGNLDIELPQPTRNEIGEIAKALKIFQINGLEQCELKEALQKHKESLEQEVSKQTADLLEINAELEEFTYRTFHDLRSPIVSSIRLLEISQRSITENNADKAMQSLTFAHSGLKKLETLTEDILALARSKKLQEEDVEIDISKIITDVLEKFSHMEGFDTIDIQKELDFNNPIFTKQTRFTMIVENMISNAIKYKDSHKESAFIRITTRLSGNSMVLEVEDNGLGIPQDQQNKMFMMFQRFHPRTSFGSGLGLYLMKKSADILEACIEYENTQNDGSIFRLIMPLKEENQ